MKVSAAFSGPVDIDARPDLVLWSGRCVVDDGCELVAVNARQYAARLKGEVGRQVHVTVSRQRMRRSNPANAYYWSWVLPHIHAGLRQRAEWNGRLFTLTLWQLHTAFKHKFLSKIEPDLGMPVEPSTAVLDDIQFSEYLSNLKAWANDPKRVIQVCETEGGHEDGCPMLGRAA